MKLTRFACAAILAATAAPAFSANLGVSVSIGQPGFYGRVDVGAVPQPQVVYRQPIIVERRRLAGQPLYLHVPAHHARQWHKHCRSYNACGEQVYLVQNDWYQRDYLPQHVQRIEHYPRYGGQRNAYRESYRGDHGYERRRDDGQRGRQ